MEKQFEDAFNPNNKFHARWLKDLVNCKDMPNMLVHNPFGIPVAKESYRLYFDIVQRLSRKFINSSVCYNFGELFSYEYAYHMDGEYQRCRLLKSVNEFHKGKYFEYALVYPTMICFYEHDDDDEPALTLERW